MPNSASAKKRLRQSEVRRTRNRAVRTGVRSLIRKVRAAIAEGNATAAEEGFRVAAKRLDQCVAKGIYHKNTVARAKSRLSKAVKGVKTAS